MKTQKIDIKALTSELKNRSRDVIKSEAGSGKDISIQPDRSLVNEPADEQFLNLIREVNSRDNYKMDRFIYVDNDIHEVFNKLKTHTKLKLSYLASHLLEEFILEHQESIKEIISKKQNKFLDA